MTQIHLGTITVDGTDVTIESSVTTDSSFVAASQQVTIIQPSASNANHVRQFRITNNGITCKRLGVPAVAISLTDFAKLAVAVEPLLSFAPYITSQPADVSVADEAAGSFEFDVVSELSLTITWEIREWSDETGYGEWAEVTTGDSVSVDGDTTTATLDFTAGIDSFTNKAQVRATCENTLGETITREALLTITV